MNALPRHARVSFDPNIRREWLNDKIRRQWQPILARADYILPSAGEAMLMTGAEDDDAACRQLAAARQSRAAKTRRVRLPGVCR